MLARDIRACRAGSAQYTCWLDERGFVVEDGVILHPRRDEYLLTSAEPNLAWFADRIGRLDVRIEEVSDEIGALARAGAAVARAARAAGARRSSACRSSASTRPRSAAPRCS